MRQGLLIRQRMICSGILAILLGCTLTTASPYRLPRDLGLPSLSASSNRTENLSSYNLTQDSPEPWYDSWKIFPFLEEGNRSFTTIRGGLWAKAPFLQASAQPKSSAPGIAWTDFTRLFLTFAEPPPGGPGVIYIGNKGKDWRANDFRFGGTYHLGDLQPLKWSPESRPDMEPSEAFDLVKRFHDPKEEDPPRMYCSFRIIRFLEPWAFWHEIVYKFKECDKHGKDVGVATVGTSSKRVTYESTRMTPT